MASLHINDLASIVENAATIDRLRPQTGNPTFIRNYLNSMTDKGLGELFHAIDQLVQNAKYVRASTIDVAPQEV